MANLSAGRRRALVGITLGVLALSGGLLVARSPGLRASFRAAYIAFNDPSRVDADRGELYEGRPSRAAAELEQPEIASDFDPVREDNLADAGEALLATLTLPDLQIPISQRTMKFVEYFAAGAKGRPAFAERFRRAGRYRSFIEQSL